MECHTNKETKIMNEPKVNQIGKAVIVEFETQKEAETFYHSLKTATKIYRILKEDENRI